MEATQALYSEANQPLYYTVSQLSEILPLGKNSIYRLVSQSDFPKMVVGKKILIRSDELDSYLSKTLYGKIDL
ncbi:helix-turn-helix domain-containing protein [Paenibacillus sp. JSM ZJ436]|uniref:helix-turn-helix domain-containing protein n=1 Tax=Paenibacillus sp. JSM ZJ436 TaxID=3376190 RepID=UPI00379CA490